MNWRKKLEIARRRADEAAGLEPEQAQEETSFSEKSFSFDQAMDDAIIELDRAGKTWGAVPEATRVRAMVLEDQLTQAMNRGDQLAYQKYLRQWLDCFH